jgi:hypothetical protein
MFALLEDLCRFMRVPRLIRFNEKCFRQKLYRKWKHAFCIQYIHFFRKSCSLGDNVKKF